MTLVADDGTSALDSMVRGCACPRCKQSAISVDAQTSMLREATRAAAFAAMVVDARVFAMARPLLFVNAGNNSNGARGTSTNAAASLPSLMTRRGAAVVFVDSPRFERALCSTHCDGDGDAALLDEAMSVVDGGVCAQLTPTARVACMMAMMRVINFEQMHKARRLRAALWRYIYVWRRRVYGDDDDDDNGGVTSPTPPDNIESIVVSVADMIYAAVGSAPSLDAAMALPSMPELVVGGDGDGGDDDDNASLFTELLADVRGLASTLVSLLFREQKKGARASSSVPPQPSPPFAVLRAALRRVRESRDPAAYARCRVLRSSALIRGVSCEFADDAGVLRCVCTCGKSVCEKALEVRAELMLACEALVCLFALSFAKLDATAAADANAAADELLADASKERAAAEARRARQAQRRAERALLSARPRDAPTVPVVVVVRRVESPPPPPPTTARARPAPAAVAATTYTHQKKKYRRRKTRVPSPPLPAQATEDIDDVVVEESSAAPRALAAAAATEPDFSAYAEMSDAEFDAHLAWLSETVWRRQPQQQQS